jgi:hypothetical protein
MKIKMKKKIAILFTILALAGIVPMVSACHIKKSDTNSIIKTQPKTSKIEVVPTMNADIKNDNAMWVGTFQIVWNEMLDNIVHHPAEFVGGTNKTAQDLNKREFNKTDISENSYYTKFGTISPDLKKEIEKGIKEKFNETSDILDSIDFTYDPMKLLIYAMLKKDFKFLEAFDKLNNGIFGTLSDTEVEYFGIDSESSYKLYKNVSVLFYNNRDDYAVKLHTKSNDEVILYRTDDVKKLNEYFSDIQLKSKAFKDNHFGTNDRLKVPNISLYQMTNFKDLEGKDIKGTNFRIDQTIETIDFKMDNEGVKLKSEAAIVMKCTSAGGPPPKIRYFYFDKDFVMFLIEKDKSVPYFALKATDIDALNKTGKK